MALIEVKDLAKSFGQVRAVDGVSLHIEAGEFITLLGPSGSGKTTVLRLIAGFEDADKGSITLSGEDITHLPPFDRDVNTVFQDYALFPHMSVAENIEYGLRVKGVAKNERRAQAENALAQVRLSGYGDRKPHELSGGQRQRIAIARAIVADPRVLVLDDATSAVDPTKEHEIRDALATVMRGRTTLVIAHRPATIELADRAVLLDNGVIAASGSHHELLETNEKYREVLAAMATPKVVE